MTHAAMKTGTQILRAIAKILVMPGSLAAVATWSGEAPPSCAAAKEQVRWPTLSSQPVGERKRR